MPVNYQIPPWLKPADPAGAYAKGFGLGNQAGHVQAQIAMERARLNQEATQQALAITLKQQQVEHENMVEQQKLEVAKAYHQQQTELQAQALQQKERVLQDKIKEEAARQLAITQFRQAVASGEDPTNAMLKYGAGIPSLSGPTSTALRTSEARKAESVTPQIMEVDLGDGRKQKLVFNPRTGNIHFPPSVKPENIPGLVNSLDKTLQWSPDMFGGDTNRLASIQEAVKKRTESALSGGAAAPAAQNKINPWPVPVGTPADEKHFTKGQIYLHPTKGPVRYEGGKDFSPVTKPQASLDATSDSEYADTQAEPDTTESDNSEMS